MKVAIMQPYFFPYIGYFQLINAVDEFVVYDNIQFTKKGWINRNRILVNGKEEYFSLPLKKDSDFLNICERYLADSWPEERKKMLNRIKESYRKAPHFERVFTVIESALLFEKKNLFEFIFNTILVIKDYLKIKTPLIISSSLLIDHSSKSENKVLEISKARKSTTYLNPIGGLELYSRKNFENEGIKLVFHKSNEIIYKQYDNGFIPFLSIIDVMMFNSIEKIQPFLESFYTLI